MTSPQQAEIGRVSHVGVALALRRKLHGDNLAGINEVVHEVTRGSHLTTSRRAVIIVRTGISTFLRHFVPAEPWFLDASEMELAGRRVDLRWRHPDGRSFFDEVKTQPFTLMSSDPGVWDQVHTYLAPGSAHDPRFIGLRLISIGIPWGRIPIPSLGGRLADIEGVER